MVSQSLMIKKKWYKSDLTEGTLYYVGDITITRTHVPPSVTIAPATNATTLSATINRTLRPYGYPLQLITFNGE